MVVKVQLKGLKVYARRGRWYVYFRGTPKWLIKGFVGARDELMAKLGDPDVLAVYNARIKRDLNRVYAEGTLGSLIGWFKTDCPRYEKLAEATRKDYDAAFEWLR